MSDPRDDRESDAPASSPESSPPTGHAATDGDPMVGTRVADFDTDAAPSTADTSGVGASPATPESLASRIDGASGPDRVAIAMLVGVLVLLLICLAFAFAAR